MNGFLVHPRVADFRLGLDLLLSETDGGVGVDSDRAGISADLGLFPYSNYPARLFFRRQLYDFSVPSDSGLVPIIGVADAGTDLGGRVRLRKGPLRGTLLGFERSSVDFLDPASDREERDREFLGWSRAGRRLRHHFRVEHRRQAFGTVDLEVDDLTLNFDQSGDLTDLWSWQLFGVGIRRDLSIPGGTTIDTDDYRIRQRAYREVRQTDLLDISVNLGLLRTDPGFESRSRGASVTYRWRFAPRWELAPFGQYAQQAADGESLRSPSAGLSLTWNRARGALDLLLTSRVAYGRTERRGPGPSEDGSQLAWSVSGSVGHGGARKLRKELETETARNELRLDREARLDLPLLGLPAREFGAEDFFRIRGTLERAWESRRLDAWVEWRARESSDEVSERRFSSETTQASLQIAGRSWSAQGSAGQTDLESDLGGDQEVSFVGSAVSWRARRWLRLRGHYRADRRSFFFAPDLEGERIDLDLEVRIGRLTFLARAFEINERSLGGPERTNRGFNWSLTRGFAGWLPIVTGTRGRGVIQ